MMLTLYFWFAFLLGHMALQHLTLGYYSPNSVAYARLLKHV